MDDTSHANKGQLTIRDVGQILDLLVRDLYGHDPHLTVRELIQNAHDALVDLPNQMLAGAKITLRVDALGEEKYFEVADNGIGMTRQQLQDNLCAIGDSNKLSRPDLIGRFGIGFLSAFILGDRVRVTTRPIDSPYTYIWETVDRRNWKIDEIRSHTFDHGTIVRVYFGDASPRSDRERLLDLQVAKRLRHVVQRYCYLLPFPIRIESASVGRPSSIATPIVNTLTPPWDDESAALAAFPILFEEDQPMYIHRFTEINPETGATASGVLYFREEVPESSVLQLYVQRILVDAEDTRLLPSYAPFVQGLIECAQLSTDLSRRHTVQFDFTYVWLQEVVVRQFIIAFIQFAETRKADFMSFWPRLEGLVIPRMLWNLVAGDPVSAQFAFSFFKQCTPLMPLRILDSTQGVQAQPTLMSINDLRRKSSRAAQPVLIYFTESTSPVEKSMLLSKHKRIVDVSAVDLTAHKDLVYAIQAHASNFPAFALHRLEADRFEPLRPDEREAWEDLIGRIEANLIVPGRTYEILVERFAPDTTPVVVTDLSIDPQALAHARRSISRFMDMPEMKVVGREVDGLLENLETRGASLTLHLNAECEMMSRLVTLDNRDVALSVALSACMRAVVQHYGWHAGRQATLQESLQYSNLMIAFLSMTEENATFRQHDNEMRERMRILDDELAKERERNKQRESKHFDAIVGFVDMVDSTRQVIRNPAGSPADVNQFLKFVLAHLADELTNIATVSGFTGDGLQFYLEEPPSIGSHRQAFRTLTQLSERVKDLFERSEEVRNIVRRVRVEAPRLRIALAFGEIYRGRVVSDFDLIGLPAVEASRLCAMRELYAHEACELMITHEAYDRGAEWRFWAATDFVPATTSGVEFAGLEGRQVRLYRPKPK